MTTTPSRTNAHSLSTTHPLSKTLSSLLGLTIVGIAPALLPTTLTAQTQTGHDALANATVALKNQLARGGVNVNVSLRDPGSQAGGEQRYRPPTTSGAGSFITEGSAAEAPIPSGLGAGQIHLVL